MSVAEKHAYNAESGAFPASCQQALDIIRALGDLGGVTGTLSELGNLQRIAGDYPGAAAILCQALELFRDIGGRHGQAETLNNPGELLTRSSASHQARDHHTQALSIARGAIDTTDGKKTAWSNPKTMDVHANLRRYIEPVRHGLAGVHPNFRSPSPNGGSRATPAASDRHAVRLAFQRVRVLIAEYCR